MLFRSGVGEQRELDTQDLRSRHARWLPDGKQLVISGNRGDGPVQLHKLDLETGAISLIPGIERLSSNFEVSPDGRWLAVRAGDAPWALYPIDGGEARQIPGLRPDDDLMPWTMESNSVLVVAGSTLPCKLDRIDLDTGARTPWRELMPPDTSGVSSMRGFRFTPDGKTYGYTFAVQLDDLYLVENLR